jgi:ribose transport system ATP-binding protein
MPAHSAPLLRASGVTKTYGSVAALKGVDLELRGGEVMALLGENGSGKSTLVKILGGLVARDAGTIEINGEELPLGTPARSRTAGIAVVTQEFSLIPGLSAAENVFLGSGLGGAWSQRRLQALASSHLDEVGLPTARRGIPVEQLGVGERQLVEIARVLARDARILIFDEPTAALSDVEIEDVLVLVKRVVASGRGVVYVTHRLGEVFEIAHRATVFRDGSSQPPVEISGLTVDGLIERMLGRALTTMFPARASRPGSVLLQAKGVLTRGLTRPVDLSVREGEIVGLAGQLGSGTEEFIEAIGGARAMVAGSVTLNARPIGGKGVAGAIAAGIAFCSSDRKRDGIFERRTVADNLTSPSLKAITPLGWFSSRRARTLALGLAKRVQVREDRLRAPIAALSGGNQQKVALGKWLGIAPRVLVVQEPTRGVDVGARAEIYAQLRGLAEEGMGIIFGSSDLTEVIGLSDTVVTFFRGQQVRAQPAAAAKEEDVMLDVTHGSYREHVA